MIAFRKIVIKNIVVLVSGGTNFQAFIDAEKRGEIKGGNITCVISSEDCAPKTQKTI